MTQTVDTLNPQIEVDSVAMGEFLNQMTRNSQKIRSFLKYTSIYCMYDVISCSSGDSVYHKHCLFFKKKIGYVENCRKTVRLQDFLLYLKFTGKNSV